VGGYFHRHIGYNANIVDDKVYEKIGVHYSFPRLGGLTIGGNVKAHLTRADYTEVIISMPIRIKSY